MTVQALIERLQDFPSQAEVELALEIWRDGELKKQYETTLTEVDMAYGRPYLVGKVGE